MKTTLMKLVVVAVCFAASFHKHNALAQAPPGQPQHAAASAPLLFTANDCLDFGLDLGSPVSVDYYDQAPFAFNGKIENAHVQYLAPPAY
jgi:hypothetical protein